MAKPDVAHKIVREALERGDYKREPCEVCGYEPAHAHHDDYSKPHDVRWLCRKHHTRHHADLRARGLAPRLEFREYPAKAAEMDAKRLEHEQRIIQAQKHVEETQIAYRAATAARKQLIVEGLEMGISGSRIARSTKLSRARIAQLRYSPIDT